MRLLDLFCCQGGAGMGYHRAGFEVVGVDIDPQPRYPFEFHQADAFEYLAEHWREFDAFHASPPCQAYTVAQSIQGKTHPELVIPIREAFEAIGLPWIIENVPGAPLVDPVVLCGSMFDLGTYRHRLFESNVPLSAPPHPKHVIKTTPLGLPPEPGKHMTVVGHFSGVEQAKRAMGIDWMTRDGLSESIPPAYTEWVGSQLLSHIRQTNQKVGIA